MHSMHTGLRRRHRLAEQAAIIHEMDMAIIREGGASQLSQEELRLVMMMIISNEHTLWLAVLFHIHIILGSDLSRYFFTQCLLYRFTHSHTVTSQACFLRGLNPITMKTEDMIHWLTQWIVVSQVVDRSSLSLLLHCPILLGYNQPSNWMLIH